MPAPQEEPMVPVPRHLQPRRILVAEDNEVNLALILDILSIQGHETIVARNGQEAVDLAVARRPHLILMDVRMPLLTGLEATQRLREREDFQDVPIIALTASTGSDAEERQLAAGMTAHLAKPIQAAALFAVLEQHLPRS
jgi:CheY-like chemotaxis protein